MKIFSSFYPHLAINSNLEYLVVSFVQVFKVMQGGNMILWKCVFGGTQSQKKDMNFSPHKTNCPR